MASQSGPRRHGQHDSTSTAVYRPQPGSPTLTNPDMILPDYDDPDPLDHHMQAPLHMWNHAGDDGFQMTDMLNSGAMQLTTPIIYGNGTMLSDIGEVTEVESNAGVPVRRIPSHRSERSEQDAALRSSPTMGAKNFARKQRIAARERRPSIESVSTVTSHDKEHGGAFVDFDDGMSVDDSNFQGDDEESVIDAFLHEDTVARNDAQDVSRLVVDQSQNEDRYSTSSISRRAEEILANAKRRLTTMEGNLSRARGFSYSSVSDGSTPSPPMPRSSSAMLQSPQTRSPHHTRNVSENSPATPKASAIPQRSASALGAAGGYRQLPMSKSDNNVVAMRSLRNGHGISQLPLDTALEPLNEDDDVSYADSNRDSAQIGYYRSPTIGSYQDPADIPRSSSAAQMRDIQDQMKGLKGKIFTLREQAQADSMKRRSLQSLRTPSPFTHSRWDQNIKESQQAPRSVSEQHATAPSGGVGVLGSPFQPEFPSQDVDQYRERTSDEAAGWQKSDREPALRRQTPVQDLHHAFVNNEGIEQVKINERSPPAQRHQDVNGSETADEEHGVRHGEMHAVNGDGDANLRERDVDQDTVSESGDSLYQDAQQNSMSHEDREDAFDYEHFFLHSAMGSYRRRGSEGSVSSDGSASTTRAPVYGRERRLSIDTTASMESFATATEGRTSKASNVDGEEAEETDEAEEEAEEYSAREPHYESEEMGTERAVSRNTATFGLNGGIASGSDDSPSSSNERGGHQRNLSYRKFGASSPASRHGLHRPSISSFESTGTNRSFPLVSRSRLSGSTSTPRDSPDLQLRQPQHRESPLRDRTSIHSTSTVSAEEYSPTVVPLSREDQVLVDRLASSFNKCVGGLTDPKITSSMRETYRRRIEAARRALEGEDELY